MTVRQLLRMLRPTGFLALFLVAVPAAAQDFDGDEIPDSIEEQLWYQQAGGSPQIQDVWVECDFMKKTVRRRNKLRRRAEGAFERAPVPGGIALHLTFDDRLPFEEQWGDLETQEGIFETYGELLEAYENNFDAAPFSGANAETMRPYVHYCTFVNSLDEGGVSGISWDSTTIFSGIPGDIFIVALGQYQGILSKRFLRRAETGVFLHELGHNLGLSHGGARPRRHANNKPNYLSVMNYHHTFGFVHLAADGTPEFFNYWDYSRAKSSLVHERRLREVEGISLPLEAVFTDTPELEEILGLTFCPDGSLAAFRWNAPLDFDCDDELDTGKIKVDTNQDGKRNKLGRVQVDWDNLVFDGGALANQPPSQAPTFIFPSEEPGLEEILWLERELERLDTTRVPEPQRPDVP